MKIGKIIVAGMALCAMACLAACLTESSAQADGDWEAELTPWHDPAVSKRPAVGQQAGETLHYVTDELIPYLHQEYGEIPIVLGGYSLGALFSLWAGSESTVLLPSQLCHPRCGLRDGWTMHACIPSRHPTSISASATVRNIHATRFLHRLATTYAGNMNT